MQKYISLNIRSLRLFLVLLILVVLGVTSCRVDKVSTSCCFNKNKAEERSFKEELKEKLWLASDIVEVKTYDLPKIIKSKRLRVLTTYSYNNYFVHEGKIYGFEYNMMEEYKKFLNQGKDKDELKIKFVYIPLPDDLLIKALNLGYGDIIAANRTIIKEREREVNFTDPYLEGLKEVLITNKGVSGIEKIQDLSKRKIYVRINSSYYYSLLKMNKILRKERIRPIEIKTLTGMLNTGDIIELVNEGIIDMTIADSHLAAIAEKAFTNIRARNDIAFNDNVEYGWMVRKNNPALKKSLNEFIQTVKKGTLLGNIYYQRYYERHPWVKDSLKREDYSKFSQYAPLFKKYGDMYGLDWRLLEAQAYQESRLNPNKISRAGAIGLMQVLPSTARYVGFEDISDNDKNVHAGVKYLRYVIDTYYKDKKISTDDQMRFALAAYNAGPSNIQRSRKAAREMGYDSNKWFNNSELGILKVMGFEPVYYVRNINKIYLSFLISDILEDVKKDIKIDLKGKSDGSMSQTHPE